VVNHLSDLPEKVVRQLRPAWRGEPPFGGAMGG
jgi:hypothetical protein